MCITEKDSGGCYNRSSEHHAAVAVSRVQLTRQYNLTGGRWVDNVPIRNAAKRCITSACVRDDPSRMNKGYADLAYLHADGSIEVWEVKSATIRHARTQAQSEAQWYANWLMRNGTTTYAYVGRPMNPVTYEGTGSNGRGLAEGVLGGGAILYYRGERRDPDPVNVPHAIPTTAPRSPSGPAEPTSTPAAPQMAPGPDGGLIPAPEDTYQHDPVPAWAMGDIDWGNVAATVGAAGMTALLWTAATAVSLPQAILGVN
jgi:hypothetical protein